MKHNKCRGCGLVNFGEATACQRCGLSLGAHVHKHRSGPRRGGALGSFAPLRRRLFAALVLASAVFGGTYVYRHPAANALRETITSQVAGTQPTPRTTSGPPHLSDDAKKPRRTMTLEEFEDALGGGGEKAAEQSDDLNRSEANRAYEEAHDRALRAGMQQQRHAEEQTHNNQNYTERSPAAASRRR